MPGLLDWLFGGSAQAQTIPPIPQGAVPQPVPATVPRTGNPLLGADRNVQIQAALAGLGQVGQNLAEQYRRRPVGAQPGPMGNVSDTVTRSMMAAYQRRQQERQEAEDARWSELQASNPALAGLPREVGQQVLARTLTREPPDPRRNFITTRTGIYRIGPDGNPQLVQGPGMGGGGSGGAAGAGAPGGMFRGTSIEAQALNILTRGDPSTPEYAAVYAREARPRSAMVPDVNGNLVLSDITPDMSHFRPPTYRPPVPGQAPVAPPVAIDPTGYVAGGAQATVQPSDGPSPTAPAIPLPGAPPVAPMQPRAINEPEYRYGRPPDQSQGAQAAPAQAPGTSRVQPVGPPRFREVPATAMQGLTENVSGLARIDRALEALDRNPSAVGIIPGIANSTGITGTLWDRVDQEGVAARAAIADLSSMVVHQRSGANVTVGEMPRLRPFIPNVGDSVETVRTKLAGLRRAIEEETEALREIYSPSQGYRPLPNPIARQRAATPLQPVIAPDAAPSAVPPRGAAPAAPGQPRAGSTALENRAPGPSRYRTGQIPSARDITMMGVNQRDDVAAIANRWAELNEEQQAAVRARLRAIADEVRRGQR